jgi:hypothetical protein
METSIVPEVAKILNLKSANAIALNFASSAPRAASGANAFLPSSFQRGSGWIGWYSRCGSGS